MELSLIYDGVLKIINHYLRKELEAQGHYLTGQLEQSLNGRISKNILTGYAVDYAMLINEGVPAEDITWKLLPALTRYFMLRGFTEPDAKRFAFNTIHKQMQEGMSTQASKRFSETGARHHFIEAAFTYPEIDNFMSINFDFAIDEEYNRTKTETI